MVKRSARARTMRLDIHPDGTVSITAPYFFGFEAIERFVEKHMAWITRHVQKAKQRTILRIKRGEIPMHKKRAKLLAEERCEYFAQLYGVRYNKITIRAQKSRWGSCSHKGNLSFNYKIALLPPAIVDYIIVHEICHLLEMNHGKNFWSEVIRTVPDHKTLRKHLNKYASMYF